MTAFLRLTLLMGALVFAGACSTPLGPDGSDAGGDCHTPIELSSRTYTQLAGTEVGTVAPGRPLGTGQFAPCDDGGGPEGASREVYSLPGVPSEQAVVLLGALATGERSISAPTRRPPGGAPTCSR